MPPPVDEHKTRPEITSEEELLPAMATPPSPSANMDANEYQMTPQQQRKLKFDHERDKNNHWKKLHVFAFRFLIGSLAAVVVLYVMDVILINKDLKNSEYFAPVFEYAKYVCSLFLGFLFGAKASEE